MLLVGLSDPRSEMGLSLLKRPPLPASAAIAAAAFMLISIAARLIDDVIVGVVVGDGLRREGELG